MALTASAYVVGGSGRCRRALEHRTSTTLKSLWRRVPSSGFMFLFSICLINLFHVRKFLLYGTSTRNLNELYLPSNSSRSNSSSASASANFSYKSSRHFSQFFAFSNALYSSSSIKSLISPPKSVDFGMDSTRMGTSLIASHEFGRVVIVANLLSSVLNSSGSMSSSHFGMSTFGFIANAERPAT